MKRKIFISFIMVLALTAFINPVKIVKSDLAITEKGNFNDDYIFGGKELDFSGSTANIIFGGKKLTFGGSTKESIISVGKEIVINGVIGNNVYAAGTKVLINGRVNGNLYAVGQEVTIGKDAVINGTLIIAGKDLKVMGSVAGDIYSGSAELIISGTIGGNAVISAGRKLSLSDRAKINGNLNYKSALQLTDAEKAKVAGSVDYKEIHVWEKRNKDVKSPKIFFIVIKTVSMLAFIIGGLLLLLFPALKVFDERKSLRNYWISGAWGLIPFLIYPAVIILFLVLGVTIPLAMILFLAGLPLLFITQFLGVVLTGQQFFNVFNWKNKSRFLYFLFASIFFVILHFVPFLAVFTVLFFSSIGWGAILETLFKKKLA